MCVTTADTNQSNAYNDEMKLKRKLSKYANECLEKKERKEGSAVRNLVGFFFLVGLVHFTGLNQKNIITRYLVQLNGNV